MVKGCTQIIITTSIQIDLIFTNRPERITRSCDMLTGVSDHNVLIISRKLTNRQFATHSGKNDHIGIPRSTRDDFKSAMTNLNSDNSLLFNDVGIISQCFNENLQSKINEFSARIKSKSKAQSLSWVL